MKYAKLSAMLHELSSENDIPAKRLAPHFHEHAWITKTYRSDYLLSTKLTCKTY